jgi:hypothetical protein
MLLVAMDVRHTAYHGRGFEAAGRHHRPDGLAICDLE